MIRPSFVVPIPHLPDFATLSAFNTAYGPVAMADPKYREKLRPIELLVTNETDPRELRRLVTLTRPTHVTIWTTAETAALTIKNLSLGLDAELAIVVPAGDVRLYETAADADVSIIAFPPAPERAAWLKELRASTAWRDDQWHHYMELTDAAELHALVNLGAKFASLHTDLPIRLATTETVGPWTRLDAEAIAGAKETAGAIVEVCR